MGQEILAACRKAVTGNKAKVTDDVGLTIGSLSDHSGRYVYNRPHAGGHMADS
jgi:hypothetical protein